MPSDPLEPGTLVGNYVIRHVLGEGGMGTVYEAENLALHKRVAIKTLRPEYARNEQALARFVREGQSASKVRHRHVADVYDVGAFDGVPYLVMEFLEGEDLGHFLAREGRMRVEDAADLFLPVLAAIQAAHDEGIVHRDLKPDNIYLAKSRDGDRHPKVLDFGISKVLSDSSQLGLTKTGTMMGTAYYMSPEQAAEAKSIDARTDLYSLGVILYECVTGRRPYEAETLYGLITQIMEGQRATPSSLVPDLPPSLERVIDRAMAKSPGDRYPSATEFGGALYSFASLESQVIWKRAFGLATSATLPADMSGALGALGRERLASGGVAPISREAVGAGAPQSAEPRVPKEVQVSPELPLRQTTMSGSATSLERSMQRPGRSRLLLAAGGLVGLLAVGAIALAMRSGAAPSSTATPSRSAASAVRVEPAPSVSTPPSTAPQHPDTAGRELPTALPAGASAERMNTNVADGLASPRGVSGRRANSSGAGGAVVRAAHGNGLGPVATTTPTTTATPTAAAAGRSTSPPATRAASTPPAANADASERGHGTIDPPAAVRAAGANNSSIF